MSPSLLANQDTFITVSVSTFAYPLTSPIKVKVFPFLSFPKNLTNVVGNDV